MTKEDDDGISLASSDDHKGDYNEERKRAKQARICKMDSLVKELEGLLTQDELCILTPVIGFYCRKCEEFFEDLQTAEKHAAIHLSSHSISTVQMDKHAEDNIQLRCFSISSNQHLHPSNKRDFKGYGYHQDRMNHKDYQQDQRGEIDHKSKCGNRQRGYRAPGHGNLSMMEEMRKERMLITVSHGLAPHLSVQVKQEVSKELKAIGKHGKDNKEKSSKDSNENDDSCHSSDHDRGKTLKAKLHKKKKKEKKKKQKKDKL